MEVIQKMDAQELTQCPHCQNSTLKKCVSQAAFRLGGNGWYETDEKPKSKQKYLKDGPSTEKSSGTSGQEGSSSSASAKTPTGSTS